MGLSTAAGLGIAAGVSALSSGANAVMQTKLNKKNRNWQDSVRRENRGWALEDWKRQTDYSALLGRAQGAGISKAYALSESSMQAPSTNSADTPSAESRAPQINSPVSMADMLSATSIGADIERTKADAESLKAGTALTQSKTITENIIQAEKELSMAVQSGNFEEWLSLKQHREDLRVLEKANFEADLRATLSRAGYTDEQIKTEIKNRELSEERNLREWKQLFLNERATVTGERNAATGEKNAATGERNAATGERNAATGEKAQAGQEPYYGKDPAPWTFGPHGSPSGLRDNLTAIIENVMRFLPWSTR